MGYGDISVQFGVGRRAGTVHGYNQRAALINHCGSYGACVVVKGSNDVAARSDDLIFQIGGNVTRTDPYGNGYILCITQRIGYGQGHDIIVVFDSRQIDVCQRFGIYRVDMPGFDNFGAFRKVRTFDFGVHPP